MKKLILKPYTEITLIKKRKNIINRKHINHNIDSDILIKEHLKSKLKYQKNSVYHRLVTSIKLSKSTKSKNKNDDDNDTSNDTVNIDTVDDISEIDHNLDDYNLSDNDDNDNDNDDDNNIDDISTIISDNDDNENFDEEEGIDEVIEVDEIDDIDEDINNSDYKKREFLYYKKLLNKQGFVFDENKECILATQEYIH